MQKFVMDFWCGDRLPIIDGILHKNGNFYAVDVNPENYEVCVHAAKPFDVHAKNYEKWASNVDALAQTENEKWQVFCGQGSYGGDGFVLVLSKAGVFEWLFFHGYANPFEAVELKDGTLRVVNNMQVLWEFDLQNPEKLNTKPLAAK